MQELLDLGLHWIRTLLGTQLADSIVAAGCSNGLPTLPLRVGQGFLDVDIFSCLHGHDGCQAVPMVAGGDHHNIDVVGVQQVAEVIPGLRLRVVELHDLDTSLVRIAQPGDIDPVDLRKLFGQPAGASAATNKADIDGIICIGCP